MHRNVKIVIAVVAAIAIASGATGLRSGGGVFGVLFPAGLAAVVAYLLFLPFRWIVEPWKAARVQKTVVFEVAEVAGRSTKTIATSWVAQTRVKTTVYDRQSTTRHRSNAYEVGVAELQRFFRVMGTLTFAAIGITFIGNLTQHPKWAAVAISWPVGLLATVATGRTRALIAIARRQRSRGRRQLMVLSQTWL